MRVLIGSREQRPFPFHGARYEGVTTEVDALTIGDYSLAGLVDGVQLPGNVDMALATG